jgi:hypothetical protein
MTRKPRSKADTEAVQVATPEVSADVSANKNIAEFIKSALVPPPITKSENYRTIYANHTKIGITQWDFTVTFGQTTENNEGKNIIEEVISIRFSPQYFKNFANTILASVQQWEATFGEIQIGLGQGANIAGMTAVFEGIKQILENAENQNKS